MRKLVFFFSVIFSLGRIAGQGFNGTIEFKYTTQKDTTLNMYSVKDKKVKLDQFSKKTNTIEGSFLFDLASGEIKFLNPKRKLWGKQESKTPQLIKGQCTVVKGPSAKTIAGQKCKEFIVKNPDENTVITYWITESNFNFFAPLIKLWNRKDKQSIYFGQIKGLPDGSMPMLSEERQINDNKLLTKLEVVKISKTVPDATAFEIPKDYNKFDQ